jgi:hypothetical protein
VTDVIDATAAEAAAGGPAGERSVQELAAELFERAKAEGSTGRSTDLPDSVERTSPSRVNSGHNVQPAL